MGRVILLMVGRPGLSFLRSTDNGATWSEPTWIDYPNSANSVFMVMEKGHRVMVFGDQGADWQHPRQYGIWNRMVDVRPAR